MVITQKKITSSFVLKIAERTVSYGISLVVQIVLARILFPSDFGSLAIMIAITNYAMLFVQSGLPTALIRKKEIDQDDVSTVFTASIVVALIMYIAIFILAPFLSYYFNNSELIWPIRVLSLTLFLYAINGVQNALFTRSFRFKQVLIKSLISVPLSGVIGIAFASLGLGIWSLIAQNFMSILITVIVMLYGLDYRLKIGFRWEKAKALYSFGGKILVTNLVNGLYDASRTLAIGKQYNSDSLAYYDKANTYTYYINQIVNSSISSVLLPTFSQKQNDIERLCEMARKSVRMSSFLMMPALIGCATISRVLIPLLLTEKWAACIPFFVVFCFIRIPEIIKTIDIQVYYSLGKSGLHLYYSVIMCGLSIIALLISLYINVLAVAFAALIVEYLSLIVVCIISCRVFGYKVSERIKDIIKPLSNSAIMAIVVFALGYYLSFSPVVSIVLQVATGIVVYLIMAFITRDGSLNEVLYMFKDFKGRRKSEENN